jgi:hypothetical protein
MTEHITQAINAAMQPKPASVGGFEHLLRIYGDTRILAKIGRVPASEIQESFNDVVKEFTQQAEALAQALAENSNLNSELTAALENWGHMQEECKKTPC